MQIKLFFKFVRYETLGLKFKIVDNKAVPEIFQYNGQLKLYLFIKYMKFIKKQALSSLHSCSLLEAFLLFLSKGLSPSFFFLPFFIRCGSILLEIRCIWQHTATNSPFSLYEYAKICTVGYAWEMKFLLKLFCFFFLFVLWISVKACLT